MYREIMNDLEEEMKHYLFDIDVFYSDLAVLKDKKLKELAISVLNYISVSGNDSITFKRPDIVSFLSKDPSALQLLFGAFYRGRKFNVDGKLCKCYGGHHFVRNITVSEKAGNESVTVRFFPSFVAYLTDGADGLRSALRSEGYV